MKPSLLVWLLLAFLPAAAPFIPQFEDISERAGLTQIFPNGGTLSKQYIIETTGSGVAFLDYDNDGLLDIFVASGDGAPSRLYHNEGHNRFRDVSQAMGITKVGWAEGVCAGDYDNDGYVDLFVTYWGQNTLYHNEGGKHFRDVTAQVGLTQDRTRYNTGCAFLDYDRDGRLDLFVANYLKFSFEETPKPGANPYCWYMQMPVNCGPRGLPFDRNILYHANSDGTFTDVSVKSGIAEPNQSYCLTALTGDFDNDGWPDIFVACDQTPSLLYMNQHDGTFKEEALLRGAALNEDGKAVSGMGAAAADYSRSGWLAIFRTNFSDERETLYRNNGHAEFEDSTQAAGGLGRNTRFVGWGCAFFDFDNDGSSDLMLVNGHVFPEVDRKQTDIRYKDRRILYRNVEGKFEDISEQAGSGITARHSSRGLATGDIDNDGTLELLINNQGERPSLLKQASKPTGNWILLDLKGTRSNRSSIGARVRLTAAGVTQIDEVRSGGSYLSQNDLRLHFGLSSAHTVDSIEIDWPSGTHQLLKDVPCCRVTPVTEPVAK